MPKKETSKYFYILSIIGALLVIAIAVGSSYAFFTNTKTHSTATVITSGSLTLELNDGAVVGTTQNMIPGDSITKSFSVTNTSNQALAYDIYLSEIFNNFADKSDLVYRINSTDGGYNTLSDTEVPSEVGLQSKIIDSHVINAGDTQHYTLTIKFLSKNKNQDNNKGKSFSAKIQINDYTSYKIAMLKDGPTVNSTMGTLAGSKSNITSVRRATSLDENATKEVVSTDDSSNDIYMWYDSNGSTLYYYTDASRIYLNEDSSSLFEEFYHVKSIDTEIFDTSNVTNMYCMFYDNYALTSIDLSNFNTSGVTDMGYMFYECNSLKSLDLNNFNTSNVENMECMFMYDNDLESLNVSSFDTSNVTNMYGMFYDCSYLISLDLSNFDTTNVTDMGWMFGELYDLESLNIRSFDTSNVVTMEGMFYDFDYLTSLDLSSFDTSKVEDMEGMFKYSNSLEVIYVSELWDTSLVSYGSDMFDDCYNIVGEKGTEYDSDYTGLDYARVDEGESNPGYLTFKASPDAGKSITITLHPGEGSLSSTTINATIGQTLGELPTPTLSDSDMELKGWYSDSEFTNEVTSSTKVTKKLTDLYAKYDYKLNANGYNYWNEESPSWNGYSSTSVPEHVYPNYTYIISQDNPSFMRTLYENGLPNGHEPCVYYNDKVFCMKQGYWESIIGSRALSSANGATVAESLKNDMEEAFGLPVDHCSSSYSHAFCYYDTIYCGTNMDPDSLIFCAKTADFKGCQVFYDGYVSANCDRV